MMSRFTKIDKLLKGKKVHHSGEFSMSATQMQTFYVYTRKFTQI